MVFFRESIFKKENVSATQRPVVFPGSVDKFVWNSVNIVAPLPGGRKSTEGGH